MLPKELKKGVTLGLLLILSVCSAFAQVEYKCFQCSGDSCEDPIQTTCTSKDDEKKCYTQFNNEITDIIAMGCIDDFQNDTDIVDLIKQKSFLICNGDDCNNLNNFPNPHDCISCSSDTSVSCAISPNSVVTECTYHHLLYNQCYERVNSAKSGITERGCLASLTDDDFYNCLTNKDSNCFICTGDHCNKAIIPTDRLQCHRCKSTEDPKCHGTPTKKSYCPRYKTNDNCFTTYDSNGTTHRGCASDFDNFNCNPNDKFCNVCAKDYCNTVNLKKQAEQSYGIFQDLPLNCNTCVGTDCQSGKLDPRMCEGQKYQDCLTVFDKKDQVVERGCEDAVLANYEDHCNKNPELCFNCKSNGCNTITDAKIYHECLYCDSSLNHNCVLDPNKIDVKRKCSEGCIAALYENKTNPTVYNFVRTCVEDIEMDDREMCTVENNCIKCTNKNNCNVQSIPEEGQRLSCNHCNGNDCDQPSPQSCITYAKNDQCYIYFDNKTLSIARMGCKSELTAAQVLNEAKQFLLCDGNNCNNYLILPPARFCYVCDSETDENCAADPTKVKALSRCQVYPNTECFTRIKDNGHTERGCIQNLATKDFINCKNDENNKSCEICFENNCNSELFPINRQQCQRCDSTKDKTCESAANNKQACPLYKEIDSCVTKYTNGITQRGCASELSCENSGYKNCRNCDDHNCNTIDLAAFDIGELGMFQGLPLNCYHCNNTDSCGGTSLGQFHMCENNNKQFCTIAFNKEGKVIARGCSDALEDVCQLNDNKCYDCKSNGCNLALSENDYTDCVFCDAQKNENCVFSPNKIQRSRKCHKGCMTALYPRTTDDDAAYELLRSCLNDFDLDDRINCQDGNNVKCTACEDENCNINDLGTRKSCYHCTANNCNKPKKQSCRATMENEQCFIEFDENNAIVQMGCKSNYDSPEITLLEKSKRLWLCNGDDCNTSDNLPELHTCTICNSRTNAQCATNPEKVESKDVCQKQPHTQCYTRVLDNGHTERGCLSSLEGDVFYSCFKGHNETACVACTGETCNQAIFPDNRRQCHVCDSAKTKQCASVPTTEEVCLNYSVNELCVSVLDRNGITTRGCSSQVNCNSSDAVLCKTCEDDNCNEENLSRKVGAQPGVWQTLPLNCHSCKNEATCSVNTTLETCESHEHCMTVFGESQNVLKRGCSDAVESQYQNYCDLNGEKCIICNSNECNGANRLDNYIQCIYCDSKTDKNCVTNPAEVGLKRLCNKYCMTALRQRDNSTTYDLSRSCLDDKDSVEQEKCLKDNENCIACEGANCNVDLLPEKRQSCYICEGDSCQLPTTGACQSYKKEDQCFVLFDNMGDVKRMGCASDLLDDFIKTNIHLLYLCSDDDNCNSYDNLPSDTRCAICHSNSDIKCAAKPNDINQFKYCGVKPNTHCATLIDTDGYTVRSCLSDLKTTEIIDCISSNSTNCKVCTEHRCNLEIYPNNRRSCNRCDSLKDVDCAEKPNDYSTICPIYRPDEQCVSRLVGNRLLHGCYSELSCNPIQKESCRICNTDNCNTVNLLAADVGEPGKWQELPLNCLHCEGVANCSTSQLTEIKKCENNNLQTCMTVFAENGEIQKRGCSNSVKETHDKYCDENSNNCIACKSNECNNATSLNDYVDCYFCDSINDRECAVKMSQTTRKRKCQKSCMVALYPRSSSNDSAYETSRSCLDDLEESDRDACASGNNELCMACDDGLCNKMIIPDNRVECYKCSDESSCEDLGESEQCDAYHPNDQCYTLYDKDSSVIAKGCRSEYNNNTLILLIKQKVLKLCDGNKCNAYENEPLPTSCSVCNSATDSRCATNPNLVGNSINCNAIPYNECYLRIDAFGHTERGCIAALDTETFYNCLTSADGLCHTCIGNDCNATDIYPSNRLQCHHCTSKDDPNCASLPKSNQVCLLYQKDDKCLSSWDNGITTRGCSSSVKCDVENNSKKCRICSSSGCNTINFDKIAENGAPGKWQSTPISCYNCKGDEDCETLKDNNNCTGDPYQNCMIVFDENNKVKQRGCSYTVEKDNLSYCEENEGKCMYCNSNKCNGDTKIEDYVQCFTCDTDNDKNCINGETISKTRTCHKSCMTALYPLFEEQNPAFGLSRSCLDDLETDQQSLCSDEDNIGCKVCAGEECNKDSLPAKRLSCYKCDDEDCTSTSAALCPNYRVNDKCYIKFDEKNEIDELGCGSERSNAEINSILKQKRLFLCDNDNCNKKEALPEPNTCAKCSSRTNVNCSINPAEVSMKDVCKTVPFTDCYERVLVDGNTERGCLSDLNDDEFLNCLNDNSDTCKKCQGEKCNSNIYPSNRLKCHICDSETDPNCEDNPNSLTICPLYDANDVCVTSFSNNMTERSCASTLNCGSTNPRRCVKCNGDGCNTVNLARKQDDNFGKWQELPLTCLTCEGEDECANIENITNKTCENNNEQDCLTIFNTDGKVISRGCSDAVEEIHGAYCDKNIDNCFNCKSNKCNTAKEKTVFVDCIYCNTFKDPNCLEASQHKTRKCQGHCMTALYPNDLNDNPGYNLIRTCLNDKEEENQSICSNGNDKYCNACEGENCNINDVVNDRSKCYSCDSNESCETPISKNCTIYKPNDFCYIEFNKMNGISRMDCISSYGNNDIVSIIQTKQVHICEGENCNTLNNIIKSTKCAQCNSVDNIECATNPLLIGNATTCSQLPYASCHSMTDSSGTTNRGCVMDLPSKQYAACIMGSDKNCEVCTKENCNREVFPADRLQCHVCTSEDDGINQDCESKPENTEPCAVYSPLYTCQTTLTGNVTKRECSNTMCNPNEYNNCRTCSKTGCNAIDLRNKVDDNYHGIWQDLPLRCHTCTDEECQHSLGPTITCANNVKQDCMTVFNADNQVIQRGCKDDVDDYRYIYCRENPEFCFTCKSNDCNDVWNITDYVSCAFCDSTINQECITNPESKNIKTRMCKNNCLVAMKGQQLMRSCLDDKELLVQSVCYDDVTGKECKTCNSKNCNKFSYPNDRLKCHVCINNLCSLTRAEHCVNYVDNDFCFAKYDNGKVNLLGCASSQNQSDIDDWIAQKQLYQCKNEECNSLSKVPQTQQCITCNSSKTAECAQSPMSVNNSAQCNAPFSDCLVRLDIGHTVRDCSTTLTETEQEACEKSGTCLTCNGHMCNNKIFPEKRLSCHTCNSVVDSDCMREPNSTKICLIYTEKERCVARYKNGLVERGCETQLQCDATDTKICQICESINCNTNLFNAAGTLFANTLLLTILALALISGRSFH